MSISFDSASQPAIEDPIPRLGGETCREEPTAARTGERVRLFDIEIDALRMKETLALLRNWMDEPSGSCRYVVTPNLDHLVMLREDHRLRAAYRDAALVLADGWPVVAASRLLGKPLPERVAGSDLVPSLMADWHDSTGPEVGCLTVFLLGAAPGVAEQAARRIQDRWPAVKVVGTYSPPLGFETDRRENDKILRLVHAAAPQLLVLGLGAPKQELWIHQQGPRIEARVALCVGATIDFLAGHRRRAPKWMQRTGLEWLYRLSGEPRRLLPRYARDAAAIPCLLARQWWHDRARNSKLSVNR